ncbi:hypothetical protein ACOTCJ_11725 [Achromobacter xylosoxidans]|uniref:hypothetical protein n=1 Tax=Alcaligenes xylosoxydans xylosoxydans TaxID=85698 RepID=UPI001EEF5344|nr:hypothetical protein [Achromobacter xylosoxidans]MDX3877629.1 hypothetical protein [Achromobacter sp.]
MRDIPTTPKEAAVSEAKNVFVVGPKTVYVVTHMRSDLDSGSVETVGQFDSHDRALKIAQALRDATPGATVEVRGEL